MVLRERILWGLRRGAEGPEDEVMDGSWLVLAFLSGMGVGSAAAIRECANACLHGGRKWWKVAIFCAEHRVSLRRFKLELDYKAYRKR